MTHKTTKTKNSHIKRHSDDGDHDHVSSPLDVTGTGQWSRKGGGRIDMWAVREDTTLAPVSSTRPQRLASESKTNVRSNIHARDPYGHNDANTRGPNTINVSRTLLLFVWCEYWCTVSVEKRYRRLIGKSDIVSPVLFYWWRYHQVDNSGFRWILTVFQYR